MSNRDNPCGFRPFGELLRARMYAVPTAPTINISVGDIVMADVTGISSGKLGTVMAVEDDQVIATTTGDDFSLIGAVLACYDEKMNPYENAPSGYIAAGETGDGTVAGYVLVADHPDQQFVAQSDGAITAANLDLNHEITSATLAAPNTRTGLSTQEIAAAGSAVTSTIPLRLYAQAYPEEDAITAAGCRFICQINPLCHLFGTGTTI